MLITKEFMESLTNENIMNFNKSLVFEDGDILFKESNVNVIVNSEDLKKYFITVAMDYRKYNLIIEQINYDFFNRFGKKSGRFIEQMFFANKINNDVELSKNYFRLSSQNPSLTSVDIISVFHIGIKNYSLFFNRVGNNYVDGGIVETSKIFDKFSHKDYTMESIPLSEISNPLLEEVLANNNEIGKFIERASEFSTFVENNFSNVNFDEPNMVSSDLFEKVFYSFFKVFEGNNIVLSMKEKNLIKLHGDVENSQVRYLDGCGLLINFTSFGTFDYLLSKNIMVMINEEGKVVIIPSEEENKCFNVKSLVIYENNDLFPKLSKILNVSSKLERIFIDLIDGKILNNETIDTIVDQFEEQIKDLV